MDIQRAIEKLQNEIEVLNKSPVHVNYLKDVEEAVETRETAISAMQELQQYRQIGTPEECRTAMQKQQAMKVTDIHVDEYYCPVCGTENCCDQGIVGDKYCPECGQALKTRG